MPRGVSITDLWVQLLLFPTAGSAAVRLSMCPTVSCTNARVHACVMSRAFTSTNSPHINVSTETPVSLREGDYMGWGGKGRGIKKGLCMKID